MKRDAGEWAAQVVLALLKALCCLALFLGSQVLVMLPATLLSMFRMMMGGGLDMDRLYQQLLEHSMALSLVADMLTLFIVFAFYLIRRRRFSEALWLRRTDGPALWAGASLAPALYLSVSLVLLALPEAWLDSYREASAGVTTGGVVGVLAVAAAAPVVEEVIFRGLIMTRLSQAMPGWLAVLLSALVFGACHWDPVWFGYAFPLGLVFGFIDWKAGSILPSILAHMAFNSIGQLLDLVPESEAGTEYLIAMGALLVLAVILPILDRKGIRGLFRREQETAQLRALPMVPGVYEFDPWEA